MRLAALLPILLLLGVALSGCSIQGGKQPQTLVESARMQLWALVGNDVDLFLEYIAPDTYYDGERGAQTRFYMESEFRSYSGSEHHNQLRGAIRDPDEFFAWDKLEIWDNATYVNKTRQQPSEQFRGFVPHSEDRFIWIPHNHPEHSAIQPWQGFYRPFENRWVQVAGPLSHF